MRWLALPSSGGHDGFEYASSGVRRAKWLRGSGWLLLQYERVASFQPNLQTSPDQLLKLMVVSGRRTRGPATSPSLKELEKLS